MSSSGFCITCLLNSVTQQEQARQRRRQEITAGKRPAWQVEAEDASDDGGLDEEAAAEECARRAAVQLDTTGAPLSVHAVLLAESWMALLLLLLQNPSMHALVCSEACMALCMKLRA